MTTLTPAQREAIAADLHAQRDALLGSVELLEREDAELVAAVGGGESRPRGEGEGDMVAVERHLHAQLSTAARTSLEEIDAALARLDAGTFGTCADCGTQIDPARLEVRPRTTTCVGCASQRR